MGLFYETYISDKFLSFFFSMPFGNSRVQFFTVKVGIITSPFASFILDLDVFLLVLIPEALLMCRLRIREEDDTVTGVFGFLDTRSVCYSLMS